MHADPAHLSFEVREIASARVVDEDYWFSPAVTRSSDSNGVAANALITILNANA
jgi:hypothetical protein